MRNVRTASERGVETGEVPAALVLDDAPRQHRALGDPVAAGDDGSRSGPPLARGRARDDDRVRRTSPRRSRAARRASATSSRPGTCSREPVGQHAARAWRRRCSAAVADRVRGAGACDAAPSPSTAATASSSVSMSGGRRDPAPIRKPPYRPRTVSTGTSSSSRCSTYRRTVRSSTAELRGELAPPCGCRRPAAARAARARGRSDGACADHLSDTGRVSPGIPPTVGASRRRRPPMEFASARIITSDVDRSVAFYSAPARPSSRSGSHPCSPRSARRRGTLAIGHPSTVPGRRVRRGPRRVARRVPGGEPCGGRRRARRASATGRRSRRPPTDMPWGNRSLLLRDPDGTLVNVYAPLR